jgi:hypothetical protein
MDANLLLTTKTRKRECAESVQSMEVDTHGILFYEC